MNSAHKWLIAGLSLFLIFYSSFVVWYYFEKSSIPTSQPELAQNVSDQGGKVLAGCIFCPGFFVKDSSTNQAITDARVKLLTPPVWDECRISKTNGPGETSSNPDDWYFYYDDLGNGVSEYIIYCSGSPTLFDGHYSVFVTRNGYQQKTVPLYYGTEDTIYLDKITSSAPTVKKTIPTTTKNETIKNVTLPPVFTAAGSTTTNLATIANPKNVTNLTLDVVGKSKVVFSDSIDLSTTTAKDLFKQLDSYVRLTTSGVVDVDSSVLSMLANKKASISMFNLPFVDRPDILVNGKLATSKIVSNVIYKNKTLSFDVTGFSKYEAVPKLTIIEPSNGFVSEKKEITLRGKITDPTATVSAKLNGVSLGKLKVATASGEFSTNLRLAKGTNNIRVEALSKFGPPLVATASAVFKPLVSSEMFIIGGIGLALILIVVIVWWYYKKRRSKIISTI